MVPCTEGTATATVRQVKHGKPVLENCGFYPLVPGQDIEDNVRHVIRTQGLGKAHCTTVLEMGDYQLLLVEAPEVPPSELRAAIRWRIRDLIDFHIDDAVLDVFDTPASGARGVQEHLYVVVSRSATVKERVELLQNAGATLEVIDIPELALRNIAAQVEQEATGLALLFFEAERGLITLTRDATLYLARSMDIGYQQLLESPQLVDRLALELQRSMDYYDRHFQQAPVSSIAICPFPRLAAPLCEQLEQQVGIPVRAIALEDIVDVREPAPADHVAHCLIAIGAALRTEAAEL
ncbi:type IV pilus biogenesis protein PilM [Thiogranum longum]